MISQQNRFFCLSKEPFAARFFLANCNVCPEMIPEIFVQRQGSDYWQLILQEQSLLNVVAMVSFHYESSQLRQHDHSIKSQHSSSPGIKLPLSKYYLIGYSKENSATKSSSWLSFARRSQYLQLLSKDTSRILRQTENVTFQKNFRYFRKF